MRKRIALQGIAIVLALVASTLALPASRSADAGGGDATVTRTRGEQVRGPITIQRLLSSRVDWALRLSRALRVLDLPRPTEFGTHTIIDEPDPTSARPPGAPPGERPEPEERDEGEHGDDGTGHQQELKSLG